MKAMIFDVFEVFVVACSHRECPALYTRPPRCASLQRQGPNLHLPSRLWRRER